MSTRILTLLLVLPFIFVPTAEAQSSRSAVTGTVTDAEGAPLPGAQIVDVAFQRGTTAGPDGRYTLDGLPPGDHTLEIRFVGYQTATREIALQAGETREISVSLKERVLETDGVTVTGTARARSTLTTPQSVDVLGAEDLDTDRSASLGGVLSENVAGVSSIQTGSQAGKPVLRGLSGSRIRVLKDGIGQEYYQFGVRHFPTTSSNEAERIEVVRGPSSIQYGSDALGGAINVLTKDAPTADLNETQVGGTVRSQYFANNNERAVGLDLEGARGPVGVRVGVERRIADNYTAPDEPTFFDTGNGGTFGDPKYTGEVPFTNFEQWNGYAQIGTQGDFGTAQVYGDYWINRHNFLLPTGGPGAQNADGQGQNLEHGNLVAKANLVADGFVLRPRLSLQTSIRQAGTADGKAPLSVIEDKGGFDDFDYPLNLKTDIYTGRLEVTHPKIGAVSGTLGAEVQFQDANTRGPAELQPTADTWNVGLFAFEEIDLAPWTLNAGVRGDVRTVEAVPNENTEDPDALENDYLTLSGALGANVKVADGIALATNLSSGFRAPSIFELYANGVHGGVAAFQVGDPNLDPERAYSADVSVRVRRDRLTAEVTGYVNAINDYIFLENTGDTRTLPTGNTLPEFVASQTDAVIPGVEAKVEAQLRPWLHVGGQFTVLGGTGDGLGSDGAEGDLPLLPANSVQGFVHLTPDGQGPLRSPRVEVDLKRGFDKDAAGRFEPFSQFDEGFGPPFGTASTKGYTTVDASAEGRFALGLGAQPSLRVAVRNVFDTTYRDFLDTYKGYALSPGRDVRVSLSVPF